MNVPPDFEKNLQMAANEAILTPQQVETGGRLYQKLTENDKKRPEVYLIIFQAIKLLDELKTTPEDQLFKKGFDLLCNLSESSLKKGNLHQLILRSKSPASFSDFVAGFTGTSPVITKATKIAEGGFGVVYKVDQIGGLTLSELGRLAKLSQPAPELALKVAKKEKEAALLSEIQFLSKLHASDKLSAEEKAALPPKPIKVTYTTKELFQTPVVETGFITKFYAGGSLRKYLWSYRSTKELIEISSQLIYQLSLLSKAGAVYTDINLDNILVDTSTHPPTVQFSDFGGCYFSDDLQKVGPGHFVSTRPHTKKEDAAQLLSAVNAAFTQNDETSIQKFQKQLDIHMSRATALLLCELFSGIPVPELKTEDIGYTQADLINYNNCDPLKELHQTIYGDRVKYQQLAVVIYRMLALDPRANPISPQEAWRAWDAVISL